MGWWPVYGVPPEEAGNVQSGRHRQGQQVGARRRPLGTALGAARLRPEDGVEGIGCFPAVLGVLLCADDKAEKGEEKDPAVVTQSDEAPAEEDHLGPNCYYDKSKSFFDNISSELKTRLETGGRGEASVSGWEDSLSRNSEEATLSRRPACTLRFRAALGGLLAFLP